MHRPNNLLSSTTVLHCFDDFISKSVIFDIWWVSGILFHLNWISEFFFFTFDFRILTRFWENKALYGMCSRDISFKTNHCSLVFVAIMYEAILVCTESDSIAYDKKSWGKSYYVSYVRFMFVHGGSNILIMVGPTVVRQTCQMQWWTKT